MRARTLKYVRFNLVDAAAFLDLVLPKSLFSDRLLLDPCGRTAAKTSVGPKLALFCPCSGAKKENRDKSQKLLVLA